MLHYSPDSSFDFTEDRNQQLVLSRADSSETVPRGKLNFSLTWDDTPRSRSSPLLVLLGEQGEIIEWRTDRNPIPWYLTFQGPRTGPSGERIGDSECSILIKLEASVRSKIWCYFFCLCCTGPEPGAGKKRRRQRQTDQSIRRSSLWISDAGGRVMGRYRCLKERKTTGILACLYRMHEESLSETSSVVRDQTVWIFRVFGKSCKMGNGFTPEGKTILHQCLLSHMPLAAISPNCSIFPSKTQFEEARNHMKTLPRRTGDQVQFIEFHARGEDLPKMDIIGHADPILYFYVLAGDDGATPTLVYTSETIKNTANPIWNTATVPVWENFSPDSLVLIGCEDWDRFKSNDWIGTTDVIPVSQLLTRASEEEDTSQHRRLELKFRKGELVGDDPDGESRGWITFDSFRVRDGFEDGAPKTEEYLQAKRRVNELREGLVANQEEGSRS